MVQELNAIRLEPKSGQTKRLVVLLHGYGADAQDLASLAPYWEEELPDTAFVTPNAPFPCESSPLGYQWFSIEEYTEEALFAGVKEAHPILDHFLDQELKRYGLNDADMVLGGFSQGAMMSYYTAPRRKSACAGIVGYSGRLFDAEGLKADPIVKPPVLAVHGDADMVVDAHCLGSADQGFTEAGFEIETILRPGLAHGIDEFGLMRGLSFCQEVFDKQR